ncbi:MAG: hypothetical protein ACI9KS_000675 [Sulfitobacter sp.]|jgi:hypothetical protein
MMTNRSRLLALPFGAQAEITRLGQRAGCVARSDLSP